MQLFFRTVFVIVFLLAFASNAQNWEPKVGIQTWTLRNMNFDQVVKFCVEHKIKYLQLIPTQLDAFGSQEELKRKKAILDQNGLVCYTVGVVNATLDKEHNRKLFEAAKLMGWKVVIVEPGDFKILDNLEELAREYDVKVAIHNHGIKSLYGNPVVVKNLLQHRDRRMGVCLDVGHVTGAGFDTAKVFKDYDGRVYDIHLKDKAIKKTTNDDAKKLPPDDVVMDVAIGTGHTNFKGLFAELKKAGWDGILAIETDNAQFAGNPVTFVTEAIKFVEANKPQ